MTKKIETSADKIVRYSSPGRVAGQVEDIKRKLSELEESSGMNESQVQDLIDQSLADAEVEPDTKMYHIDNTRIDSYDEDGSSQRPFKSILAALNKAKSNGGGDSRPYSFVLATGTYDENIVLNDTGLFSVTLSSLGRVAIDPESGDALVSNADNSDLKDLVVRNIEFAQPVVISGSTTVDNFKTVEYE